MQAGVSAIEDDAEVDQRDDVANDRGQSGAGQTHSGHPDQPEHQDRAESNFEDADHHAGFHGGHGVAGGTQGVGGQHLESHGDLADHLDAHVVGAQGDDALRQSEESEQRLGKEDADASQESGVREAEGEGLKYDVVGQGGVAHADRAGDHGPHGGVDALAEREADHDVLLGGAETGDSAEAAE